MFNLISSFFATTVSDPAQSIADFQSMVEPVVQRSVQWGLQVGIGIVGAQAFYALVVRITRV